MVDILNGIIWLVVINVILTIILLLFMTKYPKYILFAYNAYNRMKYGIAKKKIKGTTHTFKYFERGSPTAPTILCVHGFSSSKDSYLGIYKHMPKKYHVVAVDLPGHGETPCVASDIGISNFVEALNEFVKALQLDEKKFHLVGCSMGGHIAGIYASLHPENLLSLCMVCPHGIEHKSHDKMIEEGKANGKFVLLPQTTAELREMFNRLTHKKIEFPDIILSGILQLRLEKNVYYRQLGEVLIEPESKNLLERNLHKITTPVLVVWGKNDHILHPDCIEVIKEKLPSPPKKAVVLEDVGHGIFLERPRKFIFILIDFINSLDNC